MSDSLLHISSVEGPVLPAQAKQGLDRIYGDVPSVTCGCDSLGQCCELTEEEAADEWATMYPLYAVEYLNIVDYVRVNFSPEDQERLLSFNEERPLRCPFLTEIGGCSIHPARPLTCRTYGILTPEDVKETKDRLMGDVPTVWLGAFQRNESCTVCPHTEVDEPEKVHDHAERMAAFVYDRALIELAEIDDGLSDDRRDLLTKASGKYRISRWTWGGYNTLWRNPISWLKKNLVGYLDRSGLAE
jgi:Fe-S-cluster containining protein